MGSQFVRYFSGLGEGYNRTPSKDIDVRETVLNGFFTVDKNRVVKYSNRVAGAFISQSGIPAGFYDILQRSFHINNRGHYEEYLGVMGNWFDVIVYHCDELISFSFKCLHQPSGKEDLQLQLIRLNGLYRVVTELTSDCLWEWDLETKEIFWIDGGHKRVFGYQIDNALIPQSFWEDRIHPEDRQRVLESLTKINVLDPAAIWQQEYRFRKANGEYAHVRDRAKVVHDKELEGLRMTGTTQDITSGKSLELQLALEKSKKDPSIPVHNFEALEKERLGIADELYNNLNQILCAARLHLEYARTNNDHVMESLEISSGYVLGVINEIESLCRKLRQPGMYQGLFDSIRLLVKKQCRFHRVVIEFNTNGIEEEDLEDVLQLDLYRMIQELVDNIIKHAGATLAWIDISRYQNEITLLVSDNGKGCELTGSKMGTGIIQILNYADLYESRVERISEPGNGYVFKVVLPLSGRRKIFPQSLSDYDD